jgi:hypothetical protein
MEIPLPVPHLRYLLVTDFLQSARVEPGFEAITCMAG